MVHTGNLRCYPLLQWTEGMDNTGVVPTCLDSFLSITTGVSNPFLQGLLSFDFHI